MGICVVCRAVGATGLLSPQAFWHLDLLIDIMGTVTKLLDKTKREKDMLADGISI